MKFLSWILLLPLAFVLIIFCVSNRGLVPVDLWPLPYLIDLPLSALLIVTLMVGVLWGGVAAWLKAGRKRRDARRKRYEVQSQTHEINRLNKEIERLKAGISSSNQSVSRETILHDNGGKSPKILKLGNNGSSH